MGSGRRPRQVADQIRAVLASLIQTELRDPRVGFVTLTGVHVSPDLRNARIYVSVLDEAHEEAAMLGLHRAAGFLRKGLAAQLRLKIVPRLTFLPDSSLRTGARIEKILSGQEPVPDGGEE